jgi:hypothetical protein
MAAEKQMQVPLRPAATTRPTYRAAGYGGAGRSSRYATSSAWTPIAGQVVTVICSGKRNRL